METVRVVPTSKGLGEVHSTFSITLTHSAQAAASSKHLNKAAALQGRVTSDFMRIGASVKKSRSTFLHSLKVSAMLKYLQNYNGKPG
jgi:hypothetical protein